MYRDHSPRWLQILTVAAALIAVMPLIWLVMVSLRGNVFGGGELSLLNYRTVLFETQLPRNFLNSLAVASASAALTLLCALLGAYAATRFRFRGRSLLMHSLLATSLIPMIAILVPLYIYVAWAGLLNTYAILVIVYTGVFLPATLWLMQSFLEQVPVELEEAALVDGCTRFGAFRLILLPQLTPALIACGMIVFVNVWNEFLVALTLAPRHEMRTISVGLFFFIAESGVQWGRLTAGSVMSLLPPALMFLVLQRYLIHGLSAGAVK